MKEQQDKQAFFALYIGQQIYRCSIYSQKYLVAGAHLEELGIDRTVEEWLQLKPLSAISDEDAIEVGKIITRGVKGLKEKFNYALHGRLYVSVWEKSAYKDDVSRVIDFLRSKGYLLPFREYTTEDIIALGWAKID